MTLVLGNSDSGLVAVKTLLPETEGEIGQEMAAVFTGECEVEVEWCSKVMMERGSLVSASSLCFLPSPHSVHSHRLRPKGFVYSLHLPPPLRSLPSLYPPTFSHSTF